LEEKVDGILTLLQSVKDPVRRVEVNPLASSTAGTPVLDGHQNTIARGMADRSRTVNDIDDIPVVMGSTPSFTGSSPSITGVNGSNIGIPAPPSFAFNAVEISESSYHSFCGPALEEAEKYLTGFRTQVLINFAFIHIPADTTAQQLRQKRPFLFLVIMAVSSTSRSQRLALGRDIKQMLAREFLVENEGNFDMLLGLLVFLTWFVILFQHKELFLIISRGHDQFVNTPLASRFMHLATGMVYELRLNKPPSKEAAKMFNLGPHDGDKEEAIPITRTMEERRAVLGCFVLSSMYDFTLVSDSQLTLLACLGTMQR
jgi:hypothetical protein